MIGLRLGRCVDIQSYPLTVGLSRKQQSRNPGLDADILNDRALFAMETSENVGTAWDMATCCGLFVLPDVFQAQFLAEPTALVGLEEHLHSFQAQITSAKIVGGTICQHLRVAEQPLSLFVLLVGALLGTSAVVTMSFANTLDIGHEQCSFAQLKGEVGEGCTDNSMSTILFPINETSIGSELHKLSGHILLATETFQFCFIIGLDWAICVARHEVQKIVDPSMLATLVSEVSGIVVSDSCLLGIDVHCGQWVDITFFHPFAHFGHHVFLVSHAQAHIAKSVAMPHASFCKWVPSDGNLRLHTPRVKIASIKLIEDPVRLDVPFAEFIFIEVKNDVSQFKGLGFFDAFLLFLLSLFAILRTLVPRFCLLLRQRHGARSCDRACHRAEGSTKGGGAG
mmetsp:Transcript_37318/g.58965  ORF Transcript_37318/g.58965 Transcript_37318/m.58965 type:complete len:396 (-) Transcript_37318:132-1319(-)